MSFLRLSKNISSDLVIPKSPLSSMKMLSSADNPSPLGKKVAGTFPRRGWTRAYAGQSI